MAEIGDPTKSPVVVEAANLFTDAKLGPADHLVQFYEGDEYLAATVAEFLGKGVPTGDRLTVIATAEHRNAFQRRLESDGFAVDSLLRSGQLILLDAHETLATFMRDGEPDPALFEASVGQLIAAQAATARGARLRAYGEMVDVLWIAGQRTAAIRLEELWNDLQTRHAFTLLCAYSMASFYKEPADLQPICAVHTHVAVNDGEDHHASQLAREIAHRKEIEQALRESLRDRRRKEDELRHTEAMLKDFVENAVIGIHQVGPDGIILWVNQAELELLGYTRDEYIGRPISDIHADRHVIDDIFARLTGGEELHSYEARLRAKDGSIKHVLISSNVYAREGQFIHTRCFTRDITQRKYAARALAMRTERLLKVTSALADAVTTAEVFEAVVDHVSTAVEASTAALWLVDDDGRTVRLTRTIGHSETALKAFETLQLDTDHLIPALDSLRRGEPIWIASQAELLREYPHLVTTVTAGRAYRVSCLPLISRGRTLGVLGLTLDATQEASDDERSFLLLVARYASQAIERLRLFEAERRSRAEADRLHRENAEARTRAEQLYRFAQSAVSAVTVEEVFAAALDAIEAALGTTRAGILVFDDAGVMRFRAWRGLSDTYRTAVEGHSPWTRDTIAPQPVLVPDVETDVAMAGYLPLFQRERIGSLAFIPLVTRGRLIGKFMVYFGRGHTYSSTEIELASAIGNHLASVTSRFAVVAELEQTIHYNELFAGVLAHDLRNPLGAMMMAAQFVLMRQEGEGDRNAKPLSRILSSGQRMTRMIDQLLDVTRARVGGGIEIQPRDTNLADLCSQAVGELELVYPDRKIQCEVVGDQGGSWDADRVLQIISNLVANAGQHGSPGTGIVIRLDGRGPDAVVIEIQNQGVVPAELLPHLFDPFRGTRDRRDHSQGLGLGLFIVKELVRAHGGTVNVASSEATGTTFQLRLPRRASRTM